MISAIFGAVDPVNAILLALMWWRVERVESRTRRIETQHMEDPANE